MTVHTPILQDLETCAAALRSGETDPFDVVDAFEAHLRRREPEIQAFVYEADRADRLRRRIHDLVERYPEPADRPPLFAVPVGIKDVFHVAGLDTGAGSRVPPAELAGKEARAVTLLRDAGALIVGKTASTELAYFGPGPTRNPHNPEHTPGGSSSGSAAAVAAGMAPLALGTQTIGSVGRPAAFCGVVGFKPTYGRISRRGVIPLAPSLDHVGTFTSSVGGAQLAASILIEDWRAELTDDDEAQRPPVLAIPEGPYLEHASEEGLARFEEACERLRRAGFRIETAAVLEDFQEVAERHRRLVAAEAFRAHGRLLTPYGDTFHPKTLELLETGRKISDQQLEEDRDGRGPLARRLTETLRHAGADLWLTPAAPGPAPRGLSSTGNPIMNLPFTHAGVPTLVIQDNTDRGHEGLLPTGLQLAGELGADERLPAWGRAVAQALETFP